MKFESKNGVTELMIASSRGELATVEWHITGGTEVNTRDRFGYSASCTRRAGATSP